MVIELGLLKIEMLVPTIASSRCSSLHQFFDFAETWHRKVMMKVASPTCPFYHDLCFEINSIVSFANFAFG